MDDRFVRFGVPQLLPGEAFHGFGVVSQGVKFSLQPLGILPLLVEFCVQGVNAPAHLLVLLDERQVLHADQQQNGERNQGDNHLGELAPNAEVYFHPASLSLPASPRISKMPKTVF
jgi:hypothetical protein